MSEKKEAIDNDIIELTTKLQDSTIAEPKSGIIEPVDDLRNTMISFFKKRVEVLRQQDEFKEVIQDSIIHKIVNDPSVTIPQLTNLLNVVISQSNLGNESIISLFKNGQGSSPFFSMKAASTSEAGFDELSSDKLQTADKLKRLLDYLESSSKDKE